MSAKKFLFLIFVVPVVIFAITSIVVMCTMKSDIDHADAFGNDLGYLLCNGHTNELTRLMENYYYLTTETNTVRSVRKQVRKLCYDVHNLRSEQENKNGK